MYESKALAALLLEGNRGNRRLFRTFCGVAYAGKLVERGATRVVIDPAQVISGFPNGTSDTIGWTTIVVTAEMVGKRIAVFTAMEAKGPTGRLTVEQRRFLAAVRGAGGIAEVFRLSDASAERNHPSDHQPVLSTTRGSHSPE